MKEVKNMEGNNFDNAINKLQDMLSSEGGKKDIESIMGSISGNSGQSFPYDSESAGSNFVNTARSFLDNMESDNSPRTNLLRALKPYLSETRHNHVDSAIKLMSLGNIPSLLKLLRK